MEPKPRYIENLKTPLIQDHGMKIYDKDGEKYTQFFEKTEHGQKHTSEELQHPKSYSLDDIIAHDQKHLFLKSKLDSMGINTPSNTSLEGEMMVSALQYIQIHEKATKSQLYQFGQDLLQSELKENYQYMDEKRGIYKGYLMQIVALFNLAGDLFGKMKDYNSNSIQPSATQTPDTDIYIQKHTYLESDTVRYHESISKINHCLEQIEKRKQKIATKFSLN
jgi:hypothetical protein